MVRSKLNLLASISSLVQCFAAIAGSTREKTKMDITRPLLTDILVKYVLELRRTCPNYWWKTVLPAYCLFNKGPYDRKKKKNFNKQGGRGRILLGEHNIYPWVATYKFRYLRAPIVVGRLGDRRLW